MRRPIAQRTLTLLGDHPGTVTVSIFCPEPDGADYRCEYEIAGLGAPLAKYAMGVDSAQALLLALHSVAAVLSSSDAGKEGRLRWFAGTDLGFPTPAGLDDFLQFPLQSTPTGDEVIVGEGKLFERGRTLVQTRLEQLSSFTRNAFAIAEIQVSSSARFPIIVRARVEWTTESGALDSREMICIDSDGRHFSKGELIA